MKSETCVEYKKLAEEFDIKLSIHASYFIVLTSREPEKIERSTETLKRTYELAHILGSDVIVLHPGPLYGNKAGDVIEVFLENSSKVLENIGQTDIGLFVETAGKLGQLGSVDEILTISQQLSGIYPCIDFGHVHARTLGTLESPVSVEALVSRAEDYLSRQSANRIHFHYTPIHFGSRGEIQHRAINDRYPDVVQRQLFGDLSIGEGSSDGFFHPRPEVVSRSLTRLKNDFTVISETHNSQEEGAARLRDLVTKSEGPQ